jgi:hypothetical protein
MDRPQAGWWILIAPLCLVPLGVIALRARSLVPQSSFARWVGLELVILVSAGLAIGLSLWRFHERSTGLKFLAVVTIVVGAALGLLMAFSFL